MLKKTGLPVQLQKLPSAPGLPEIHHYLALALDRKGKHIQMSWFVPGEQIEFMIDIFSSLQGGDPEWKLFSEKGGKRELVWQYKSCDVLLVHNLIASSCGQIHNIIKAEGTLNVNESQRDASKTYEDYMVGIDHKHQEHGKGTLSQDNPWSRANIPMSGDLAHISMTQLLQSVGSGKMTGKLELKSHDENASIYLQEGMPIHATAGNTVGDEAVVQIMTWKDGFFVFEPRVKSDSHTVHESLDYLITRGIQLSDRLSFLRNAGLKTGSILVARQPGLSDLDFAQKASRGSPVDLATLGRFYRSLDGKRTVEEIYQQVQSYMPHNQLMLMIYHLLANELIGIGNQPTQGAKAASVVARHIDTSAIQSVMMSLRRAETGMFVYPAFLYFLEQEYFRSYRSGDPLSVIVFEMRTISHIGNEVVKQVLPTPALLDAVGRISQLKRHVDLLAHYDAFDYAMLLPDTKSSGAQIFANRILKALTSTPLAGGIEVNKLSIAFGAASIPEDFLDLSLLLGGADAAMNKARQTNQAVVMYRDIKV